MEIKSFILFIRFLVLFFFFENICFSQLVTFGSNEIEKTADAIIIGHVLDEIYLEKADSDAISKVEDYEGTLYTIQSLHVLKGDSNITQLTIFQTREDETGGEFTPVFLFTGKDYLLFLNKIKPPQYFADNYKLNDSCYYTLIYGGMCIFDINQNTGQQRLRQTEQYLKVPTFFWQVKTFSEWIEIIKIKLQSGFQNAKIGGNELVNTLNAVLSNANIYMQAMDSINCAKEINRSNNIIWGTYKGFDRMRFVSTDLFQSMLSDLLYLVQQLPEVSNGAIVHVDSLNPSKVYSGGSSFDLQIVGEDFDNGAIVYWNWSPKSTTFISSTQLQVDITSADISKPDTVTIAVVNPNGTTHGADFIVLPPPSGCNVKLVNSTGAKLTGGTLQYYEGSWKEATNNNDGTFFINTTKTSLSLRMTYEYGTQTKSNVSISSDTVVFQTVNAKVQLQNSNGVLIDTGTVKYYAGAWRDLGITVNGTASKELLPNNYSFRMTYAYASNDKKQDLNTNPIVIFQTVNAAVQLQNSQGALIDQGTVQYYSGAWREFGTTANGVANKELLSNNYSFRMTYENASIDKKQDLSTNSIVVFSTVLCTIRVKNAQNELIDGATASYYSGAWRVIGLTVNGEITKELLPLNLSFRAKYGTKQQDKKQDLSANTVVEFTLQ